MFASALAGRLDAMFGILADFYVTLPEGRLAFWGIVAAIDGASQGGSLVSVLLGLLVKKSRVSNSKARPS